jgi:hypothetical protein
MYVERALGEMVQSGRVRRHDTPSFPKYSLAHSPHAPAGHIDGKYRPFTERRLELEEPSKSGTYEDDPRKRSINDPDEAV